MVVAEIPLWLVHHSSGDSGGGGANGILNPGDSGNHLERAQDSLSLLDHTGRGKKCAIYGLDINPEGTKVATCGGDGTVRLWSVNALFSRKRSRFQDDGQYESSEASDNDNSGNNVATAKANTDDSAADAPATTEDNHPDTQQQNVEANALDNKNENDATGNDAAGEAAEQPQANGDIREDTNAVNAVHDLSNLVRKKNGEVQTSPAKPLANETSTAAGSQAKQASSSPSQQQPNTSSSQQHSPHQQQQQQQQRLLCTLSAHNGSSVLAVRFSHNGQFLASAGDDAAVCIYTQDSAAATGNLAEHFEHWSRIKLCRGHGLDVVGLAWAPDDSHLISCSLDSETPIIVWKLTELASQQRRVTHANVLCNPYKILGKDVHTSTVKGVTFDPAGTYLASSGDDPAICIWRAHDDWGLERRIDASSGIFRRWKEETAAQSLSSQTLFRRLSWSTDGAFVCSTNCVVKNKHVASTISRDGWNVSTAKSAAAGAANLVGHKQPVVVSRHCAQLLDARRRKKPQNGESGASSGSDEPLEEDEEPEYATLLALGDRQGFVTVWSTRKSRPIFKLQCSETRCTVTDLAWGKVNDNAMILLVSLLDGHVVALRFRVPEEVGPILKFQDHARVFQLRYGIDLDDAGDLDRRRLFVGDNSQPKFIENALQMSLENQKLPNIDKSVEECEDGDNASTNDDAVIMMMEGGDDDRQPEKTAQPNATAADVKSQQLVTTSKGKKRIRPVLMSVNDDETARPKKAAAMTNGEKVNGDSHKVDESHGDPLKAAQHLAEKASTAMAAMSPGKQREGAAPPDNSTADNTIPSSPTRAHHHAPAPTLAVGIGAIPPLPHRTDRIHTVDLPTVQSSAQEDAPVVAKWVASCTISLKVPTGSKGAPLQCTDLSISQDGKVSWRDQIAGSSCSALTASSKILAIGSSDGSVMLYGTSPSLGWACGKAFRSHPPFVLGHAVVALHLQEREGVAVNDEKRLDMLVVTADGAFGVYQIQPQLRLRFKGSIMPAMIHMMLGASASSNSSSSGPNDTRLPKLSRIQITASDRLLMLLSSSHVSGRAATESTGPRGSRQNAAPVSGSASGSIQAFVYNLPMELWMRISDGRFVLSDFYSTLPTNSKTSSSRGVLSRLDDSVRMGSVDSLLAPVHQSRSNAVAGHGSDIYQVTEERGNYMATRAHCEDRMACALALGSSLEFKHWLSLYVRVLSLGGHAELLRVLVDMLVGSINQEAIQDNGNQSHSLCWWLSSSPQVLNLDRKSLIRTVIIPEMSKNRALQRITNEIAMEMDAL